MFRSLNDDELKNSIRTETSPYSASVQIWSKCPPTMTITILRHLPPLTFPLTAKPSRHNIPPRYLFSTRNDVNSITLLSRPGDTQQTATISSTYSNLLHARTIPLSLFLAILDITLAVLVYTVLLQRLTNSVECFIGMVA